MLLRWCAVPNEENSRPRRAQAKRLANSLAVWPQPTAVPIKGIGTFTMSTGFKVPASRDSAPAAQTSISIPLPEAVVTAIVDELKVLKSKPVSKRDSRLRSIPIEPFGMSELLDVWVPFPGACAARLGTLFPLQAAGLPPEARWRSSQRS